jgi:hypothetical protein
MAWGGDVLRHFSFSFPAAYGLWKEIVMRSSLWRFAAPVAAIAVLAMAFTARAATVGYSTAGHFTTSGGATTYTLGTATVTYTPTANTVNTDVVNPTNAQFGTFAVVNTDGPVTINQPFWLDITQTVPVPSGGTQQLTSTVAGVLALDASGLSVTFSPTNSLTFTGLTPPISVIYTVFNTTINDPPTLTTLNGNIRTVAVPLPPAVWAGMSLMGLMGIKGYRRQRLNKTAE